MNNRGMALVCVLAAASTVCGPPRGVPADDWPQWLGPRRDSVWRETGILADLPEGGPEVLWRVPVGPGYAGPAVAGDHVYLMDRRSTTGADGKPVVAEDSSLPGTERVLCLRVDDGSTVWTHEYDCTYRIAYPAGPRATPLVEGDRVYTLGAMGDLRCLDAATGAVHWSLNLAEKYSTKPPFWGYAAHPLIDGDRLICLAGGEQSAVVALDKNSGREIWRSATAEEVGYAPPIIYESGSVRQLLVWHDVAVRSLDPQTGREFWSIPFPAGRPPDRPSVDIATPRMRGSLLLVSNYYDGSLVIDVDSEPPGGRVRWMSDRDNDGVHKQSLNALMTTPIIVGDHVYGIAGNGELRCLKLATGELVWRDVAATGERPAHFATCFLVSHEDRFFLFNDQGYLIVAHLSPAGYRETSRAKLLEPTHTARGRTVVWSHPAFAGRSIFARNDRELVRANLSAAAAKR